MAARRLSVRHLLLAMGLTLAAAAATFHLKYAVRELELELTGLREALAHQRDALQFARADLAYLTRPDRLVAHAAELGMTPGGGSRIIDPAAIIPASQLALAREPLPAVLPSGAAALLKVKPLPVNVLLVREKAR